MYSHMIASAPWVMYPEIQDDHQPELILSQPCAEDGDGVAQLIADCPPLDINSSYCNFLQSTHFSKTCVIAKQGEKVAGFISAYVKPEQPSTLFVWQVAIGPDFRGQGLAFTMLSSLLERENLNSIDAVETTITKDNQASWALFNKLDRQHGMQGKVSKFLDEHKHFKGKHDSEYLYRIPLNHNQ